MKIRDNKGSITVFVLVGLLFMTGFLIISFGSNINKSKSAKEQLDIISSIYSRGDGDASAYERAYTDIRKKNANTLTASSEGQDDTSTLELTKTFTDTLSDYKIYGNSIQDTKTYGTPSPTNPVEIQSVGDRTKNLFDAKSLTNLFATSYRYANLNLTERVTISFIDKDTSVDISDIYVGFFKEMVNGGSSGYIWNINKGKMTGNMSNISNYPTSGEICPYLVIYPYSEDVLNRLLQRFDIQIEKGDTATDYEPYGYKIPVKVSGKNLFNIESITDGDKTNYNLAISDEKITVTLLQEPSYSAFFIAQIKIDNLKQNTNYSLSGITSISDINTVYVYADKLWGNRLAIFSLDSSDSKFNTGNNTSVVIGFYWNKVTNYSAGTKVEISNIQLEEGATVTDYEPYIEPITTNIYLNEPLRKIGEYADYIDFVNKKVVRNIINEKLGSSSVGAGYVDAVSGAYTFRVNVSNSISTDYRGGFSNIIYISSTKYGSQLNDNEAMLSPASQSMFFRCGDCSTDDDIKQILDNNDVYVQYVLNTPTEETLDLPEISTFEDYTKIEILTSVAPSKIEATYYGYTME